MCGFFFLNSLRDSVLEIVIFLNNVYSVFIHVIFLCKHIHSTSNQCYVINVFGSFGSFF